MIDNLIINAEEKIMTHMNINDITEVYKCYPVELIEFCKIHNLKPPNINSGNGKALSAMLYNPDKFWTRNTCDEFVKKFNIKTKDSIQLFNKHSQWGIKTNSGTVCGKLYIVYPYALSNKHKMRKDFKYDGTKEEQNIEVEKIKLTIKNDYIDVSNDNWQLGHKNPGSIDNTNTNLVLQPPIQAKYRDDYLFFDSLTKMPLPSKLHRLIQLNEIQLTHEQINEYLNLFTLLKTIQN